MRAPQQPIELPTARSESVLEFGAPAPPDRTGRRFGVVRLARRLADDRRIVPLSAALGAVAAFTSLVSEWQVTRVDGLVLGNDRPGVGVIPADLTDLGSFAAAYLVGLFLLVAALVLTMFGPVPGRRYARTAGLAVGGTLLAMLLALTSLLGDQSRIFSRIYTLELDATQLKVGYGRGLWFALIGVAAALVALYVAGRSTTPDEAATAWSWRRPPTAEEDDLPQVPFDLTVSSANPFTSLSDDRDKPA